MRTFPGPTDRVVVVGAGLAGLSAALHLAGAGREVTVRERAPVPGGRCGLLRDGGYAFDTGPTVLTMPDILARPFAAVGERLDERLTLHRLDPAYRARFADGSHLDVHADPAAMAEQIAGACGPAEVDGYRRFVAWLTELYRTELARFIDRNLDSPLDLVGAPLVRLLALGALGRLGPTVARFFADERLRRLFSFQAMYAGLSPARALAIYAVIAYMDSVGGVYFPAGGMHAVPRALAAAATTHGVRMRYDTEVARVVVGDGHAYGVVTGDGQWIAADVVVVTADLPTACATLLTPDLVPRRVRRLRPAPSAVVLHCGSTTSYPHAAHHTIEFGTAWDATFAQVIDRGEPMTDPSFLVTNPTRTDPSLAPPGRQAYYVLFPAPNLARRRGPAVDWAGERDRYRDHMIATMQARGYPGFGAATECRHLVTPVDWQAAGLAAGTPFGAAHTFGQTGPFRPATMHPRVPNLLFAGASVQPGIGVPMVLLSGELAARRVTGRGAR